MRTLRAIAAVAAIASAVAFAVACSDDETPVGTVADAGTSTPVDSGGPIDAGGPVDSGGPIDAGGPVDAGPQPTILPLPTGAHARLFGVTYGPDGSIYAVGQTVATGTTDDLALLLVKMLPSGALDTSFAGKGYVVLNVSPGRAGEIFRGIVIQREGANAGKIVVAGAAEHDLTDAAAATRDIVLVRFDANGTPDGNFGAGGVARFPLGNGTAVTHWGLARYANDDLIVTGNRAPDLTDFDAGPDATAPTSELAVLRVKGDNGTLATFGPKGDGVFSLLLPTRISVRLAEVLGDGSAIVSGYTNPGTGARPVIVKLTPLGTLDTSFGSGGVFFPESGLSGFGEGAIVEAYAAVTQGDKLVTTGYGKESASQPAEGWLSLRLFADGGFDTSYASGGHAFFGVNGQNAASRSLVVLPDQRVVLLGGGSPPKPEAGAPTQAQRAAIAILKADGTLDPSFNAAGPKLYDLGGPATGRAAHFFWSGAVSPDKKQLAIVGIKGGILANAEAGVAAGTDQAFVFLLPTGS